MQRLRGLALIAALSLTAGCSSFIAYTDELNDSSTGRSAFVTVPATIGGAAGFAVGLPVSAVALPITFPIWALRDPNIQPEPDPESTLLFPSFVMWRLGLVLGVPFDMIEYGVYRGWQPPLTPSAEEQESLEAEIDEDLLPAYRVETIYPPAKATDGSGDKSPS